MVLAVWNWVADCLCLAFSIRAIGVDVPWQGLVLAYTAGMAAALDGLTRVLAIELLTAARALELRAPLTAGPATGAVVAALRETAAGPGPDRFLAPEIEAAVRKDRSSRRGSS